MNTSSKIQLTPFLGIDPDGKVAIFVSPFPLHKISPMHLRGRPMPNHDPERDPIGALQTVTNYYKETKKQKK